MSSDAFLNLGLRAVRLAQRLRSSTVIRFASGTMGFCPRKKRDMTKDSKRRFAKAGEEMSARAMSALKKNYPRMFGRGFDTKESITIKPKSPTVQGQWMCADCGEAFQNNMGASQHQTRHAHHRLVWWASAAGQFEEP